jgi:hypothetical protein
VALDEPEASTGRRTPTVFPGGTAALEWVKLGCCQLWDGSDSVGGVRAGLESRWLGEWNTSEDRSHQTPPQMVIIARAPEIQDMRPSEPNPIIGALLTPRPFTSSLSREYGGMPK